MSYSIVNLLLILRRLRNETIKIDWIERDVDFVIQLDDISLDDIRQKN